MVEECVGVPLKQCIYAGAHFTGGTRNNIGANLRGRRRPGVDQVVVENVYLAKNNPAVKKVKWATFIEIVDHLSGSQAENGSL